MKGYLRVTWLVVLLACAARGAAVAGAESGASLAVSHRFVVGVSPFLDKTAKDDVYRALIRLLVEDLPLDSSLTVYDAYELKTVAQVLLPNSQAFSSPKTRANQFAPALRDLKQFLAREHARPTNSPSAFAGAIRLPQFVDFLIENRHVTNAPTHLLLLGNPLYQDAREPGFSMVEGYFPSDGHLLASREKSVFGVADQSDGAPWLIVHWAWFGDPWVNDLHREKVTRFWALYFQRRAAQFAAFTGDLPSALHGFGSGSPRGGPGQHWTLDPTQTKLEMLRITRDVQVADWLTRDPTAGIAHSPPTALVGPMKIGIRWQDNIDLDIYATPRPGAETLFFQHTRSSEGYYYKDHRSSPGREFEFIEFETPVDAREVEAFVNFYNGSAPGGTRGEVRIEFDGRIYGAPFAIPAEAGNQGRTGRTQQDCWTRIPVQEVLKLVAPQRPGG